MQTSARLSAAASILDDVLTSRLPPDRLIKNYTKTRRYIGSKDRRFIADRVYFCLCHLYKLSFDRTLSGTNLVIASLSDEEKETTFTGRDPLPKIDLPAQNDLPDWASLECPQALFDLFPIDNRAELLTALQGKASFDIRINTLKTNRDAVLAELGGIPTPYSADGVRLDNTVNLQQHDLFKSGAIEVQNEASQLVGFTCNPQPSMRILDLCAGAGGKTLHLASLSQNKAKIEAYDKDQKRLSRLKTRAIRAGADIQIVDSPSGTYDLVLVDAPCSGTGTWRHNPAARLYYTAGDILQFQKIQADLIIQAKSLLNSGGKLIYSTCSVLPAENTHHFENGTVYRPDTHGTDGFFIACD